jgi:hypothetical protein
MKLSDSRLIDLGLCIIGLGILLILLPIGTTAALAGLIAVGLGCAPIYPCVIHSTPTRFGVEHSQALVGYQMALDSIDRVKALDIERILFPHFGLADPEKTAYFLSVARECAVSSANKIVEILQAGGKKEDAVQWFQDTYYHGKIKESYPYDAMMLNTGITVALLERELLLAAEC